MSKANKRLCVAALRLNCLASTRNSLRAKERVLRGERSSRLEKSGPDPSKQRHRPQARCAAGFVHGECHGFLSSFPVQMTLIQM